MLNSFAGAIFTDQEIFLFQTGALLIAVLVIGSVLFIGSKLLKKKASKKHKKLNYFSALAIGLGIVMTIVVAALIIGSVRENNWNNKQESCAKEAGYEYAWQDNSSEYATFEKQQAYNSCLGY